MVGEVKEWKDTGKMTSARAVSAAAAAALPRTRSLLILVMFCLISVKKTKKLPIFDLPHQLHVFPQGVGVGRPRSKGSLTVPGSTFTDIRQFDTIAVLSTKIAERNRRIVWCGLVVASLSANNKHTNIGWQKANRKQVE